MEISIQPFQASVFLGTFEGEPAGNIFCFIIFSDERKLSAVCGIFGGRKQIDGQKFDPLQPLEFAVNFYQLTLVSGHTNQQRQLLLLI